jgi:uncharacterized repeat protein (TIGR03803 family)
MRLSRLSALLVSVLGFAVLGFGQTVTIIHQFPSATILNPYGPPVQGRDGRLYGEVYVTGWGMVFGAETAGPASPLYTFSQTDGGGGVPESPVVLAGNGAWYGTTLLSLFGGYGVLYRITGNGAFTQLYNFEGSEYGLPAGSLIEVNNKLYGITSPYVGWAAVYTYDASGGSPDVLYQFGTSQFTTAGGGSLLHGRDGNLYGGGTGSDGCGAVFKMTTLGELLNIWSFDCSLDIGAVNAPLVEGSDGNFYGTASGGEQGTIFEVSPTGVVSLIHDFGSVSGDGTHGMGLTLGTDGNLYGTAPTGGAYKGGTVYQISSGTYLQLYSFVYATGPWRPSGLVQHTDGKFYGFLEFTNEGEYGGFYSLDMSLGPFVAFVLPSGGVGQPAEILGQGLTGTTAVTFNGVAATKFTVVSDTYMTAVVPSGATTGPVAVMTPGGTLTSNVSFRITN